MEKKKEDKKENINISYFQYLISVVIIIALAVMITISLMSCSVDEKLASELNKVSEQGQIIVDPEPMDYYIPTRPTALSVNGGVPSLIGVGAFQDGVVRLKLEYTNGNVEFITTTYKDNVIALPVTNTGYEYLSFSSDKLSFEDGYVRWEKKKNG